MAKLKIKIKKENSGLVRAKIIVKPTDKPFVRKCPVCDTPLIYQKGHSIGTLHLVCPKCKICPDCDDGSV